MNYKEVRRIETSLNAQYQMNKSDFMIPQFKLNVTGTDKEIAALFDITRN